MSFWNTIIIIHISFKWKINQMSMFYLNKVNKTKHIHKIFCLLEGIVLFDPCKKKYFQYPINFKFALSIEFNLKKHINHFIQICLSHLTFKIIHFNTWETLSSQPILTSPASAKIIASYFPSSSNFLSLVFRLPLFTEVKKISFFSITNLSKCKIYYMIFYIF